VVIRLPIEARPSTVLGLPGPSAIDADASSCEDPTHEDCVTVHVYPAESLGLILRVHLSTLGAQMLRRQLRIAIRDHKAARRNDAVQATVPMSEGYALYVANHFQGAVVDPPSGDHPGRHLGGSAYANCVCPDPTPMPGHGMPNEVPPVWSCSCASCTAALGGHDAQ